MAASAQRVVTRTAVLSGYKQLMRTTRVVFRGDKQALTASRLQVRAAFEENRKQADPAQIQELISNIREADEFLRQHIVQGHLNQAGNYEVQLTGDHASEGRIELEPAPQPKGRRGTLEKQKEQDCGCGK